MHRTYAKTVEPPEPKSGGRKERTNHREPLGNGYREPAASNWETGYKDPGTKPKNEDKEPENGY